MMFYDVKTSQNDHLKCGLYFRYSYTTFVIMATIKNKTTLLYVAPFAI